jgi:hypothetical protein
VSATDRNQGEDFVHRKPLRFRFTLREALLATVAICAVLALIRQSATFSATPFFENFDDRTTLDEACRKLNLSFRQSGRSASSGGGGDDASKRFKIYVTIPDASEAGQLVTELQSQVESQLLQHGCAIYGHGHSGNSSSNNVSDFHFKYRRGPTRGIIEVSSFVGSDKYWQIRIYMQEF